MLHSLVNPSPLHSHYHLSSPHHHPLPLLASNPHTKLLNAFPLVTRPGTPYHGARLPVVSASSFSVLKDKISHVFESFHNAEGNVDVKGCVFLQKKNLLDLNAQVAKLGDDVSELLGNKVELQLVSHDVVDPTTGIGLLSDVTYIEDWTEQGNSLAADQGSFYSANFAVHKDFGLPGALLVVNNHPSEFFLKSITLEFPDKTQIHFPCDSWVYNSRMYKSPRIFFSNQVCLPGEKTPAGLRKLRNVELEQLRGDGTGERKSHERIYDYDVYNDLGSPDKDEDYARPILGGSKEYPYPRRCRTGRSRTRTDPLSERPTEVPELVYLPRDEQFGHLKNSDFLSDSIKSFAHGVIPTLEDILHADPEFASLEDLYTLYSRGIDLSKCASKQLTEEEIKSNFKHPLDVVRELTNADITKDPHALRFPTPHIIQENKDAWRSDDEFARQTLSGLNPMVIERLKVFPPVSKLDPKIYGPPTSSITGQHIEDNLEGLTAQEALESERLFIVDYHDVFLPYITKFNALECKGYASRTLLFLTKEGTLKLVAIELSLPPTTNGGKSSQRVFTPPPPGQKDWLWELARTHASANDTGYHQLVSHWMKTHATIEPFIIATNRQLSALHPLHVLLKPHFKHTMNINALARKLLINSHTSSRVLIDGIIERSFTPGRYCMETSSVVYRDWRFDEQALPADLIKRGMAVKDPTAKHGLKLLIEDYPFAVDGLDIWFTIQNWVRDYIGIQYENDKAVVEDTELQSWWADIKEIGHGDKAGEKWWVAMRTREELEEVLLTLIWLASGYHAAVNFGQYGYGGFMPNKPTLTRRLIPEEGTEEYAEFLRNPEKFFLRTVSNELQSIIVMATLEMLSTHASDEEYLGQRLTPNWSSDESVLEAFKKFSNKISEVEREIEQRNTDPKLKNRHGDAKVPYTLLVPSSGEGLTGKGVPNSTSI